MVTPVRGDTHVGSRRRVLHGSYIETVAVAALRAQEFRVVQLALVGQDVRVRIRRHREVALSDVLTDPRPRRAAQMHKRDAAVA
jgi:hypothetical protein